MNLSLKQADGYTSVDVNEERLDVQNAEEFRRHLLQLIQSGTKTVVVDLDNVRFIDSSGLGALVYALREAKLAEADLKVANVHNQVYAMFKVTRLNKIFDILELKES